MIRIAEIFLGDAWPSLRLLRQAGVTDAVGTLPYSDSERPWEAGPMRRLRERFDDEGITLSVMESFPPIGKIQAGEDGAEQELDWVCEYIESMGAAGIGVLCYNWMTRLGWIRTSFENPGRGGALVTAYDHATSESQGPVAGPRSELQLWETLHAFLERVVPVAESAGVRLAMHPDDPPRTPVRGTARIMCSPEGFRRLLQLVPSPSNGITMCQGNFTLMQGDVPALIREFGENIHFVHFRDVRGDVDHFEETFHDEGRTDMFACMRAYRDIGFDGVLRSDHVPTVDGDSNATPGYSVIGRLHALGYALGLREAAWS